MLDSWLSGFIESDGHFSIRSTESIKSTKIECKFELSQAQKDKQQKNNLFFLEDIAKYLNCSVKPIRLGSTHPQYRIRTTNVQSNLMLIEYLSKYPLFGTKYLDYKD